MNGREHRWMAENIDGWQSRMSEKKNIAGFPD